MTFSSLIAGERLAHPSKYGSRLGNKVGHITPHHAADTSLANVLDIMAAAGGRVVSANYVIDNEGKIWGVVPEESRAFTSGAEGDGGRGAQFDRISITWEMINATGAPDYQLSQPAIAASERLAADVGKRYGFTMTRTYGGTFEGHRELYTRYGASYATACPGVYPLDAAAVQINALIAGGGIVRKDDTNMHIKPSWTGAPNARMITDLQHVEVVTDTARIAQMDLAAKATNGIPYAIYPQAGWESLAKLPAYPTAGVGGSGPTAASIAAAVDAVIDDEAILAAVQSGNTAILGKLATLPADTLAAAGLKRI